MSGKVVIWREVSGGALSTVVGLPVILACALIVTAPLDRSLLALGVQSALVCALGGTLIGSWLAGIAGQVAGPRIALSLLIAGHLAATPGVTASDFVVLVGAATVLCGLVQMTMGAVRLGSLVSFLPFPVLSGFLTAVNLGIMLSQFPLVCAGLLPQFPAQADLPQPMSILAVLATVGAMAAAVRWLPRVPGTIAGLTAGCAAFYGTGWLVQPGFTYVNEALGQLSLGNNPIAIYGMHELPLSRNLIPHAVALAILASLEALLSALTIQRMTGRPLNANRELIGMGLTNVAIGLAGGLPAAGSPLRSEAVIRAGAQTRAAPALEGLFNLCIAVFGTKLLVLVPTAVVSGTLIATTWASLRTWGVNPLLRIVRTMLTGQGLNRQRLLGDLATMLLVLAVGLLFGPSAGVGFGVVCAMALFILKSGQSLVRGTVTLRHKRSTLQRSAVAREVLDARGAEVTFIELGGSLFFGSADALVRAATPCIARRGVLIVSLEQVTDIDSSGAMALCDIARACSAAQCQFWIAGSKLIERDRSILAAAGVFDFVRPNQLIDTADHALERAENHLLEDAGSQTRHVSLPLAKAGIFRGLVGEELELVRGFLISRHLAQGEALFNRGDPVDGLYIIDEGQIGIRIEDAHGMRRRIAAFTPGTMIGEIAFVEGGDRSAQAIAEEESVLWLLKREYLPDIERANPKVVHILFANIAREVAARLRNTTEVLRQR